MALQRLCSCCWIKMPIWMLPQRCFFPTRFLFINPSPISENIYVWDSPDTSSHRSRCRTQAIQRCSRKASIVPTAFQRQIALFFVHISDLIVDQRCSLLYVQDGITALHRAIDGDYVDVARLLVDRGADVTSVSNVREFFKLQLRSGQSLRSCLYMAICILACVCHAVCTSCAWMDTWKLSFLNKIVQMPRIQVQYQGGKYVIKWLLLPRIFARIHSTTRAS